MSCLLVSLLKRHCETKTRKGALATALIGLQLISAFAWVFPEHRDIAVLAVERLDPQQQTALQKLWSEARSGHEARLCEQVADTAQGAKPTCIDFAAWTAIAENREGAERTRESGGGDRHAGPAGRRGVSKAAG